IISITKEQQQAFDDALVPREQRLRIGNYIKSLSDVKVDTLYQPWRTFGTIINKCLSGKVTGLDQLRLSRAQIIWGMYHQKNVDYVYLLWEDLVYQIKNKVSKKNKDMYYPRFTKVIINHFMSKDQSIPRRNKVDWHMANNDPILTTMRFIPKHETIQKYGAILPDTLTNQAMKESDTYKTYHDFATGKVKDSKSYRSVLKSGKKKLPAQGLETLSKIALSEAERMKIVTKRSKTQFHSLTSEFPDDMTMRYKDDDGQDNDNEQTESDNDGDDFVHPKFSTHDEEERQDEEDKDKEGSDLRVQTPSHFESTYDETYDEVTQGNNVEGEKLDEEERNEEEEVECNEQGPVTLEVQQQSSSVSSSFISNMLNPNPDIANTSYAVAANLSELELKKILIDKMENNKLIDRSVLQNNLYKALVDAYESDKYILASYGDTRRRARKEPESISAPKEKTSKSTGKSKEGYKSHQKATGKSAQVEEPIHADEDLEEPAYQEFDTGFTEDQPVNETTQHPDWEFARDVYTRNRIIGIKKLTIVEWRNYKHLEWITVCRDDDKLYTFKEGDYNRLRLQDIEDMLLLLVQGKLTNLNIEERLALGVSLRMFTRSIIIRSAGVEDLNVASNVTEKKLTTLQSPDTYRFQLMCIDELHKFSDGTLNNVRSALDDILKRIRMEYLPQDSLEKHQSDTQVIIVKMEILLQPTSNKLSGERFDTSARNPVKEILLKLNLPDHRSILMDLKMEVKVPDSSCLKDS
ncbi:hypothetical protein Tco_0836147, partial [Tanacetum coccineum]